MPSAMSIGLIIYFAVVALVGTLGNGIILLAYGNRWNSSKSTSVVFILVLACVDMWTCLVVVPTIAIMEYRDFEVPTLICRFYSFSKMLINISSLIMSFIALDRFLNIAVPHYRLLNPRRVKFLLILFILIGVGMGALTALAFSSLPNAEVYRVNYTEIHPEQPLIIKNVSTKVKITFEKRNSSTHNLSELIRELLHIPANVTITSINPTYLSTHYSCFADTSIISNTVREILRHISSKFFFISIGIVTTLYTITFILALHRQNPRIRALKKSLNVLNKFDSYPSNHHPQHATHAHAHRPRNDSVASSYSPLTNSIKMTSSGLESKGLTANDPQNYEMASFVSSDELDEQNPLHKRSQTQHLIDTTDDLRASIEKFPSMKQVSFQVAHNEETLPNSGRQPPSPLSNSFDVDLDEKTDTYYKFPCPCSTTRQLLIKFHFGQPSIDLNQWLCYCCSKKSSSPTPNDQNVAMLGPTEDETSTTLTPTSSHHPPPHTSVSNSDILKKQLHRHRIKQIRMASTFLIITVSFVLFYLPSILSAEMYIQGSLWTYYLYLCTHALNPIIYCFMNVNLRAYILSMLKCQTQQRNRSMTIGATSILER